MRFNLFEIIRDKLKPKMLKNNRPAHELAYYIIIDRSDITRIVDNAIAAGEFVGCHDGRSGDMGFVIRYKDRWWICSTNLQTLDEDSSPIYFYQANIKKCCHCNSLYAED